MINRRKTKPVKVRNLMIGGDAPVSIQSMTSVPLEDVEGTLNQIERLVREGAELVRVAVRTEKAIPFLREIRSAIDIPLSADVHFNYRIALAAILLGIDKIRINPGTLGNPEEVVEVVRAARDHGVPIRVGVNSGSVDLKKYGVVTPETLVQSAKDHIRILEENDFRDIVISIKSSDVFQTIEANKLFARSSNYPLHIGLTEAGFGMNCVIQSAVVIGHLLIEGIGDTVRVSMTGDPVEEIRVARMLLESIGLKTPAYRIISCPTCGRTDPALDILALAQAADSEMSRFTEQLRALGRTMTIAVMGCEVNGPGEAAHADLGVAGAREGKLLLFARGKKLRMVGAGEAVKALVSEAQKIIDTWERDR